MNRHVNNIKPVVATLLQQHEHLNAIGTEDKRNETKQVCKFYLLGDCQLVKCPFLHDTNTVSAICKYWAWGYCARDKKCMYLHQLVDKTTNQYPKEVEEPISMATMSTLTISTTSTTSTTTTQKTTSVATEETKKGPKKITQIVAKLRLSRLIDQFPNVNSQSIQALLIKNNYNDDITHEELTKKYGQPKVSQRSVSEPAPLLSQNNTSKSKTGNAHQTTVHWVDTGSNLNQLYKSTRSEAERHAILRNQYFIKAVDAFIKGNKKLAKDLSLKGREHDEQMKKLHSKAADAIFKERNAHLSMNIIDVHGLHIHEAVQQVKQRVQDLKRLCSQKKKNKPSRKLEILTGTGQSFCLPFKNLQNSTNFSVKKYVLEVKVASSRFFFENILLFIFFYKKKTNKIKLISHSHWSQNPTMLLLNVKKKVANMLK
ncbi:hypothetical protein RFI_06382 [Reticulomyxa filosa]|uniref:Uncharacterized protein n=1 Tax=Reticulomyxa filosa TaxID=46433 RepID=X6NY24_RETFI|nr:hypothetical protein RFI_06382 [Reticulomyxa filosa]|eukprot:ETO30734.1 hypothetical protein RFI_06382 [Reticulomyxa filosa]